MAEYIVGRDSTFRQPQDAIDAIIDATGGNTFTESHSIIFRDSGIYHPFKVPGALTPTDTHKLIITGKKGIFPSIVGSLDYEQGYIGVEVVADYVSITNLWVRNAVRGIVVTGSNATLGNMHIGHCTKGGIFVWKAEEFFGYNLNIHHVPFGFVSWESNDVALFHSNIMMVADRSYIPGACFAMKPNPTATDDIVQLRNNNFVSYAGCAIQAVLPVRFNQGIDSDYNNLFAPSGVLAKTGENIVYAKDLAEWKRKTGDDLHSISSDPVFINRESSKDGFTKIFVDLGLLAQSPLKERGENTQTATYRPQVDNAVLANDINGQARATYPTIGPNEVLIKHSYYGDDLLHAYYGGSDPCGDSNSILDVGADVYSKAVKPWYAKIRTGFFYIRDNQYYLYGDKQACDLNGITWSFFDLPVRFVNGSTYVQFQGEWLADEYWNIHGDELILKHKDLDIERLDEQVRIVGVYNTWNSATKTFAPVTGEYTYTLYDGTQKYFLSPPPQFGAPVVVTDDTISQLDYTGDLPNSFSMSYNEEYELPELTFNTTNVLRNSKFAYYDSELSPNDWYTVDTATVATGHVLEGNQVHPNYGYQYLELNSGEVRQIVPNFSADNTYYGRVRSFPITGNTLSIGMKFYASDGAYITGEATEIVAGGWSDFVSFIAPSAAAIGLLRVFSDTNVGIEAVQLDTTTGLRYTNMPRPQDMTIEWEGSDAGVYEINDLTLNPITNPYTNGFLCIPNLSANQFDATAPSYARTLLDWGWPEGRITYLPWAKTEGKNKWNHITHESPYGLPESVGYTAPIQQPSSILISPNVLYTVQGTTGDEIYFQAFDTNGNVMAHHPYQAYLWDDTGEFPGYIATREFGYYTNLGQNFTGETNSAGGAPIHVTPIEQSQVRLSSPKPIAAYGATGEAVYFFNTLYEVSPTNHGNPTITGSDGVQIAPTGELVTSERPCYPYESLYDAALTSYPWRGSVSVWDDNGDRLLEVYHDSPGIGEFYVDYENRVITSQSPGPITAEYNPRILWKDPRYKRRIYMSAEATLPTDYMLDHDVKIWFAIRVWNDRLSKWLRSRVIYLNPEALGER